MGYVGLPLTGSGDATAQVATDEINSEHYQRMKLFSGVQGSTVPIDAKETTPESTDAGMVVRPIGSTAFSQAVVGQVGISSGSSAVELTSAGSSRLVGQVTVANPTTAVSLSSQITVSATGTTKVDVSSGVVLGAGSSANMLGQVLATGTTKVDVSSGVILGAGSTANTLGAVAQAGGSTSVAPWYVISTAGGGGSTTVDANLTSAGSSKVIGTVGVSSGVVLGPSTAAIGLLSSGTQNIGTVGLSSDGSTRVVGSVNLTSGGTTGSIGSVALLAGSSANVVGQAAISSANPLYLGLGTSAAYQFVQSIPFSSGNVARSSVSSTVDTQLVAANANRKALIIANRSTAQTVGIGFSTAAVTTALANVDMFLAPSAALSFGLQGGLPLYLGPLRGINLTSTAVGGSVGVTEFT